MKTLSFFIKTQKSLTQEFTQWQGETVKHSSLQKSSPRPVKIDWVLKAEHGPQLWFDPPKEITTLCD